ncbi:sugar phosphate nucleotidyltransferase [Alicyclobacillus ferrooxydans]|uniref:sugar phosphate nucleotidyltransferase n=1 Tax=Alicyclobacillus ferrooxydans TaxID=471514 RepID=UPI0012ED88F9|nr:sugar phosphate nucleotidyltransferase [Alicyclobacillus ferrooxydans]
MAGGKGSRLRPLTSNLPKPMVPLLGRPCMEYIIDLLKRYGITEIAVTVQYLPQAIKNYFGDGSDYGVSLYYFEEETPLGTAGSVKNAEQFLDDTFVVISGDALTDFDLHQAVEFHNAKQAIGTVVMTRVENPVEYGIVQTDADGKITRFQEKPNWDEVFSNTANTGIYVFEPKVLTFFRQGQVFDFSKDLFPLLMKAGYPLYGYVANGYWSDIGNLVQYRQSQYDMLNRVVDVEIRGHELYPGVWMGENVLIHSSAAVSGPVFIGDGSVVGESAKILPFSVIGRFTRIHQGAHVERSIVWNRVSIGAAATLEGCTVCSRVNLDYGVRLQENTVVGADSQIGAKADIWTNVKVWPHRNIEPETIQNSSLIWGKTAKARLFQENGIQGIPNVDITPEFAGKLTSAYATCLNSDAVVNVSCDDEPYSEVIKYSVISSLLAAGMDARDMGSGLLAPLASFGCRTSDAGGAIHVYSIREGAESRVVLRIFNHEGKRLSADMKRKIENAFFQEDYVRPDINRLGRLQPTENVSRLYLRSTLSVLDKSGLQQRRLKVVYGCQQASVVLLMHHLLEQLGCIGIMLNDREEALAKTVVEIQADLGIYFRDNGESFHLVTDTGHRLNDDELRCIQEMIQSLAEANADRPLVTEFDAFCSNILLLSYLARTGTRLQGMVQALSAERSVAVGISDIL